jgi:hypothetical protein
MAPNPNPLDALLSSSLDPEPGPTPDVSALPPTTAAVPQPPAEQQTQQPQQGYSGPRPILFDLIQGMLKPPTRAPQVGPGGVLGPAQPVGRAEVFENFLTNFIGAMGQGFANEGRGPGAALRGAGAAINAPWQMQQQQAQFQAEQQQRQAQAQLTQQQAANLPIEQQAKLAALAPQARFDPQTQSYLGLMNDVQYQNYLKGQGAAATTARSKEAIAELNQLANSGKIARVLPVASGGYAGYDSKGNLVKVMEGAIDPAMLQRQSTAVEWKSDGAGGFMALPKTTTTGPAQGQLQSRVPALAAPQAQPPANGFPKPGSASAASAPRTGGVGGGRTYYGKGPVFAMDPQTGQQVLSTPQEVAAKGLTNPVAVKQPDIEKEKSVSSMISDVQLNKSRYLSAMEKVYSEPVTAKQAAALTALTPERLGIDIGHGFGLSLPDVMQKITNATAFSELSTAQKQAMVGYYSTLASVPGYQKALTQIGRANKEMMDLELRTIPTPLMDRETFHILLDRFQGNIDQVGQRTVRFPGIPTVQDVRQRYEGGGQSPQVGFQIPKPF